MGGLITGPRPRLFAKQQARRATNKKITRTDRTVPEINQILKPGFQLYQV